MAAAKKELAQKEQTLFKQIIKFYENKEYKKGLKSADQILKKVPDHGETMAMKGLFLSHLERKEEAHDCIKKGLKLDLKSPICWHVYGLFHRGEKNYEEAIKSYTQSLRIEKGNAQILRDLTALLFQVKHYDTLNEVCARQLELRPQMKYAWFGYAMSFHLIDQPQKAEQVLVAMMDSEPKNMAVAETQLTAYEQSEILLYRNYLIEVAGDDARALENLEEIRAKVTDKIAWLEAKARILLRLKDYAKAELEYTRLIDFNADHIGYLKGLEAAKSLDGELNPEKCEKLLRMYKTLASKFPRSHLIAKMPLHYAEGDEFEKYLGDHLLTSLRKGVPSLFNSIAILLKTPLKAIAIRKVAETFYKSLSSTGRIIADGPIESPTVFLWLTFFISQLYDHHGDPLKALEFIDIAIQHSPTVVELYMFKARIYKHGGDYQKAMNQMDRARSIDLQDRFINSKCAKYMLANNDIAAAADTVALFAKDNSPNDPDKDLTEMQAVWYAYAAGMAYMRKYMFGLALKRFQQVEKHFKDFIEDQLDFHGYVTRKQTFRSYIDMIKTFGSLHSHPFYVKTAYAAIDTYLMIHDGGKIAETLVEGISLLGMSEADQKKAMKKLRKAESRKEPGEDSKAKDEFGEKYLNDIDLLEKASDFLNNLVLYNPTEIETWRYACKLYLAKKKYLLLFRAIVKAREIDSTAPFIHLFLTHLSLELEGDDSKVAQIISQELQLNFPNYTSRDKIAATNNSLLESLDPTTYFDAVLVSKLLDPTAKCPDFFKNPSGARFEHFDLKMAITAHKLILEKFNDNETANRWKSECGKKFILAVYFNN